MLHRLTAAVLSVLGLLVIGLGIASATVWRADDILVASATPQDGTRLLVADPGVLELAGDPVTVTVEAPGDTPVVLAVGRDTDVAGWVGTDAYARVTGLSAWDTLRTEQVAATTPDDTASDDTAADGTATDEAATDATTTDGAPSDGTAADEQAAALADPRGSDLWVAESSGKGSATLTWQAEPGRWSLLVASVGDDVPTLTLSWPRTVTTPWLVPALVVGLLLLAAGATLGVRQWLRARRGEVGPEWHPVLTGAVPVVGADPAVSETSLTRRQLRELRDATLAPARRRERASSEPADATGAQPTVPAEPTKSTTGEPTNGSRPWPTPSWASARPTPAPAGAAGSAAAPSGPTPPSGAGQASPRPPAPVAGGTSAGSQSPTSLPSRGEAPATPASHASGASGTGVAGADASRAARPAASAAPNPAAGAPAPTAGRAEGRGPSWLRGRDDDVPMGRRAPAAPAAAPTPSEQDLAAAPTETSRRRDVPSLGGRWVSRGPGRGEPAPIAPAAAPAAGPAATPTAGPGHVDPHATPTRAELRRAAADGTHAAGPDRARPWGAGDAATPTRDAAPADPAWPGAAAGRPAWPHVADAEAGTSRADAWRRTWGIPGGEPLVDDTPPHPEESERR